MHDYNKVNKIIGDNFKLTEERMDEIEDQYKKIQESNIVLEEMDEEDEPQNTNNDQVKRSSKEENQKKSDSLVCSSCKEE